jgi:hypothetical protein
MRQRWLCVFVILLCAPALATVDPDPDQIGVYFDQRANQNCVVMPAASADHSLGGSGEGNIILELASPAPGNGADVVLISWLFLLNDVNPVRFYLGPSDVETVPDGLPGYVSDAGFRPLGLSNGDPAFPVADLKGDCGVVPTESLSFGGVKVLFR